MTKGLGGNFWMNRNSFSNAFQVLKYRFGFSQQQNEEILGILLLVLRIKSRGLGKNPGRPEGHHGNTESESFS